MADVIEGKITLWGQIVQHSRSMGTASDQPLWTRKTNKGLVKYLHQRSHFRIGLKTAQIVDSYGENTIAKILEHPES